MKAYSTILKLPVMEILNGKNIAQIKDVVMNPDTKNVMLLLDTSVFADLHIISKEDVEGIGNDFIMVKTSNAVKSTQDTPELMKTLNDYYSIVGLCVITSSGNVIGKIEDFTLDELSWNMHEIQLEGGEVYNVSQIISISEKYVFVQSETSVKAEEEQDIPEENGHTEPSADKKNEDAYLVGMIMKEDVANNDGSFIIRRGTVLTSELVDAAKEQGVLVNVIMNAE